MNKKFTKSSPRSNNQFITTNLIPQKRIEEVLDLSLDTKTFKQQTGEFKPWTIILFEYNAIN